MAQISFKIPKEEHEFLKWYASQTSNSISVIYREATIERFKEWKIGTLLDLYAKGTIGFKQLCSIGNISLQEGLILLEKHNIEPPIPQTVDEHTESVLDKILG
ncbi:MAG: hypothetical protein INQ03_10495 [Candidatus Heimdallarchaeota archaeon]|nr:hypothetical protein [Candidatus Heimdallarchaeota archaeon]